MLDDEGKKCYDILLRDGAQQRLRSNLLNAVSVDSAGDLDSALADIDARPNVFRMSLTADGQSAHDLQTSWPTTSSYVGDPAVACGSWDAGQASSKAQPSRKNDAALADADKKNSEQKASS